MIINIVKNSKQFNYSSDFRNKALKILSNRGITQQDLIDTHNLYNKEYLELDRLNQAYKVQSNITLVTYFIALILSVLSSKLNPILILISIVTIILFVKDIYMVLFEFVLFVKQAVFIQRIFGQVQEQRRKHAIVGIRNGKCVVAVVAYLNGCFIEDSGSRCNPFNIV